MKNINYIVDINEPPIGPPGRIIRHGFFGPKETKESIEQTKRWNDYIKKYGEELRRSKNITFERIKRELVNFIYESDKPFIICKYTDPNGTYYEAWSNGDIYIKPVKCVEYITLDFKVTKDGVKLNEKIR